MGLRALVLASVWVLGSQILAGKVLDKSTSIAGMTMSYKVVLPADFDAGKEYPAILAFPPGSQTMDLVTATLNLHWATQAGLRGYIVVIPAAPNGQLFFQEGAKVFPAFLDQLLADYKIRTRKFYVAGMANGGISAFVVAARYPQYFWSVTAFPGYLWDPSPAHVDALAGMCINLHVGELDREWLKTVVQQVADFKARGYSVRLTVEPGQGHDIRTLIGAGAARLFDEIETKPRGCAK